MATFWSSFEDKAPNGIGVVGEALQRRVVQLLLMTRVLPDLPATEGTGERVISMMENLFVWPFGRA
jgi:hypothetical protein